MSKYGRYFGRLFILKVAKKSTANYNKIIVETDLKVKEFESKGMLFTKIIPTRFNSKRQELLRDEQNRYCRLVESLGVLVSFSFE